MAVAGVFIALNAIEFIVNSLTLGVNFGRTNIF
jgi:hypothetical protein